MIVLWMSVLVSASSNAMIEKSVVSAIKVDEVYGVSSGLVGVKRDIVHGLAEIMKNGNDERTKSLFGICEEIFSWRTHHRFMGIRRSIFSGNNGVRKINTEAKKLILARDLNMDPHALEVPMSKLLLMERTREDRDDWNLRYLKNDDGRNANGMSDGWTPRYRKNVKTTPFSLYLSVCVLASAKEEILQSVYRRSRRPIFVVLI